MEKRKLNKKKIFIVISIMLVILYALFYGTRLVHYYLEENPVSSKEKDVVYVSNTILSGLTLDNSENGLFFDSNTKEYYFKGNVNNNYVYYSGKVWRILSINSNNEIKLITDENQTILNYLDYEYMNSWLNSEFYNTLLMSSNYLTKTDEYRSKIDSTDNITFDDVNKDNYVGLLSLYEYNRAGNVNSFLNTKEYYWLSNMNNNDEPWYVFDEGGVNTSNDKTSKFYGIKPVVTIKSKLSVEGSGFIDDPYLFADENDGELKNRCVGEYLTYGGYNWRIIGIFEDKIKLIMDGCIDSGETLMAFSSKSNIFNLEDKNSIASYLNNSFYKSITKEYDYLIKGEFDISALNSEDYNYKSEIEKTSELYVGLPNIHDFYINKYSDIYLMNYSSEETNLVYTINSNGRLYANKYSTELKIRPVIYIDSSLYALGHMGTQENPYVIGR